MGEEGDAKGSEVVPAARAADILVGEVTCLWSEDKTQHKRRADSTGACVGMLVL